MKSKRISVETGPRRQILDITAEVSEFVEAESDGLVNIFLPHATAGLAIMELGSGSESDLLDAIDRILPTDDVYVHAHGSVGHGADHVLPAFISPTLTLPVEDGQVVLGRWQRIAIVDTNIDNPSRELLLYFLDSA